MIRLSGPTLILGMLLLVGCSKSPPEPVWIGHLAPLTGPDKIQGEHSRQGVRLALEEVKDAVQVAGQPVEVRHADTRGEAERLQTEAVRLLTLNKVAALLDSSADPLAERLAATVRPYGTTVLVAAELPGSGGDGVFSLGAGPGPRGRALARFAATDLKATHAAVLTDARLARADALARAFVKERRQDAKARAEEWSYRSDAELAELAIRAAKAKPDVLLLAGTVADAVKARTQWEMAGLRCPVLFGGEDQGEAPLRELGTGVFLASAFAAEGLSEKGKAFARLYAERFHEPPDFFAAQAYDGTRLLAAALHRAGLPSAARVSEELANVDSFESVTGPLHFKDRRCRRPVFVLTGENGTAKVRKTFPAE